jgi:ABC-type bacteriocin/lantibiotic exporter with double-glycine peptidase domain
MAYIITYITLFVLGVAWRTIKKKACLANEDYYSDSELTWISIILIPLAIIVLMWVIYPHHKNQGGWKTSIVNKFETETILMETIEESYANRDNTETFWWCHSSVGVIVRNIRITNKLDSTQVIVKNFTSLEDYKFKKVKKK